MSFAQNKFTISGTITEQNKGEALIGVKVRIKEQSYLVNPYQIEVENGVLKGDRSKPKISIISASKITKTAKILSPQGDAAFLSQLCGN